MVISLKFLRCPFLMNMLMVVIAAAALAMALLAQYVFDLQPCILCVIQRYPYGIVIVLGLLGLFIGKKSRHWAAAGLFLIGVTFLVNSGIALYHTGVEQQWCAVPAMAGGMDQILADIQSRTEAVRCDEIPWSDPILNLSMANYNIVFCLGLGLVAICSAVMILQPKTPTTS